MKRTLSVKLFAMTLGAFFILIIGIVLVLYIYFGHYYEPKKIDSMINAINHFSQEYTESGWTDEEMYKRASAFMKNNNATISLLTLSVTPKLLVFQVYPSDLQVDKNFTITPATTTGVSITMKDNLMPALFGTVDLEVLGYNMVFIPTDIESSNIQQQEGSYATPTIRISEKVTIQTASSATADPTALSSEIRGSETINSKKNGVQFCVSTMASTPYKQVDFFKELNLEDGQRKMLAVNLSLQPVDELLNSIKDLYPFLVVMALLLSLIMAMAYSQTVSKPIVAITTAANKMAAMELDTKLKVARQDELGVLSGSLNTLSSNLKHAMEELVVANKQLKNDYEGAIRQEKARKEFVANVSHEIKTPLGVVRSFVEALRDGVKEEKKDYYMEVILDEIGKSERLIQEMLEVSRLDAGAVSYNKKETDLDWLVRKTVSGFSKSIQERALSVRIEDRLGTVFADEEKIGRVIANFLDNAVKYSDQGTVIHIKSEKTAGVNLFPEQTERGEQAKKTTRIRLRVENTCEPLPEEILERVWDRFFKGDASRNREKAGAGLGLAIVRSIMEGHGEACGVENLENGVSFYVDLTPLNQEEGKEAK